MQRSCSHKSLEQFWKSGTGFAPVGAILYQKSGNFRLLGLRTSPRGPIEVKFRTAVRTHIGTWLLALLNFTRIGATSRPCGTKMLIFGL